MLKGRYLIQNELSSEDLMYNMVTVVNNVLHALDIPNYILVFLLYKTATLTHLLMVILHDVCISKYHNIWFQINLKYLLCTKHTHIPEYTCICTHTNTQNLSINFNEDGKNLSPIFFPYIGLTYLFYLEFATMNINSVINYEVTKPNVHVVH